MNKITIALLTTVIFAGTLNTHTALGHDPCCDPVPVCCPPPPVKVPLCIQDPCTGCVTMECICVPACCACETPCMTWRKGILGRKILTYKWACCGHCVEVVITKRGKVTVRG